MDFEMAVWGFFLSIAAALLLYDWLGQSILISMALVVAYLIFAWVAINISDQPIGVAGR